MSQKTSIFIATSIDGYIADNGGGLDFLRSVPNPNNDDMGYGDFISGMDALVMGRKTFQTVLGFGIDWPYSLPVYVLSNILNTAPDNLSGKVSILNGDFKNILEQLSSNGLSHIYIDGGKTIQTFLKENMIDEMIITTVPVILGSGFKLFDQDISSIDYDLKSSKVFLNQIVQNHYVNGK
jgi:dihydrofolate reductase